MTAERIKEFRNDGLRFAVRDQGPLDGEVVILLHGFPQTGKAWTAVSNLLNSAGYRTIAPTLRGYNNGEHPRGRAKYRSSKIVGDVLTLTKMFPDKRVHLVGHDWGALLAWAFAAEHPDRLLSLTAISVPHYSAFLLSTLSSNQLIRSYYILLFQLPLIPELLFKLFPHSFRNRLLASGMSDSSANDVETDVVGTGSLTPGINWYRGLLVSNQRAMTRFVAVPTIFVWGDNDTLLGRRGAELTARFVTESYSLHILEGASHWIPEERPADLVKVFLAQQ